MVRLNVFNSLALAGIVNPSYQWYEIANNQLEGKAINNQTNPTLKLKNILNDATYYLVASWQVNKITYTLTSNQIQVNINNATKLINPTIICNKNITSALNLGTSNINDNFQFAITSTNKPNLSGKVTYSLFDVNTKQTIALLTDNASLNSSLLINSLYLSWIFSNLSATTSATVPLKVP